MERRQVIVVGAGPVGMSAAACLAGLGVDCLLLEKRDGLSKASKASTFHPPTLEILGELGVLDEMLARGRIVERIQYRNADGAVLAQFDLDLLQGQTPCPHRLHLEQSVLTALLLERLQQMPSADLRFGWAFEALAEGQGAVTVTCRTPDGSLRKVAAEYVLAADGAHSAVRATLGLGMEGHDYPGQVLRLVVTDDLAAVLPGLGQISYIFGLDGRSISLLQMPDCWRVIIRLSPGFDREKIIRPEWYMPEVRRYIPQLAGPLTLREFDIYGARRMLAAGHGGARVFLIGDALHLTNTRGGMNMNCGIHDAYAIGGAIADALTEGRPALAQEAARARRRVAEEELLPRTDRAVTGGADWLAQVQAMAADPGRTREMLVRAAMLDMAPPRGRLREAAQ